MTRTPLEQEVLDAYVLKLAGDGVPSEITDVLKEAFLADKMPTPDEILKVIAENSGEKVA